MNQLHEAKSLVAFIRKHTGDEPFVVVGDFNAPPASPVYDYLAHEAGLVDAQAVLGQIDPRHPRGFSTAGFLRLRMHLDHLFCGGGLRWVGLDGTVPYPDRSSPFYALSDHSPLIATFRV